MVEPATGLPDVDMPLTLTNAGLSPPEIMSAREMLAVGNLLSRVPELPR